MKKLEKKDILTIPNMLTMFRICLVPFIVMLYWKFHNYGATLVLIFISGVTDVADGYIARRFHMVSDLGKVLDPFADKLTQAALLLCLISRFPYMMYLFLLMAAKETILAVTGALGVHYSGKVRGAVWHGKVNTVLLYAMMAMHIVWYNIPEKLSKTSVIFVACVMTFSMVLYVVQNIKMIKESK